MLMHSDHISVMGRRFDSTRPVFFDAEAGATIETVVLDTLSRLRRDRAYSPAQAAGLLKYARCRVDGVEVPRKQWATTRPAPGARVEVLRTVHGGGGGGSKSPALAVLGIAIMAVAWYAAPAVVGAMGPTMGMATPIVGGITYANVAAFGGVMALSSLASMFTESPTLPSFSVSDAGQESPTYSITGARNAANPYGFIPLVLGTHRHTPPLGAKSWTSWEDDKQFFHMLVVWGHKDIDVSDFRIKDTPLGDFTEVEHVFHQATIGDDLTLFGKSYNETAVGTLLTQADSWVERTVGEAEDIIVDVSFQGLANINQKNGNASELTVEFDLEYREVGEETWISAGAKSATRASTTYCVASFYISDLPRAEYEVRIRRTSDDTDSRYIMDKSTWSVSRAVIHESPINSPLPLCVSELRIQASDQLSGSVDDFDGLCSSNLPIWDGEGWDTSAATSNPAAHMRYLLTNRQGLSNPYTTAKLDDTALTALYEWCDDEGLEFNFVCDSEQNLWARLAQILSAGRAAVTTDVDGLWGAVIDQPGKTAKQLFTPRNSWGFKIQRGFMELPHALRVSFVDEDDDYNTAERFVYADGYDETTATNIVSWEYPGVTNADSIWKHGRRHLAKLLHRQTAITLNTDWEWLGVHRGDLVGVASDVQMNVFGTARILRLLYEVDGEEVLVGREEDIPLDEFDEPLVPIGVQLDDTVVFSDPSPARYGIAIRDRASGLTTYEITPEYGEERDILRFAYAIPAATAPDLGTLVSVSILGEEYDEYLLSGVTPGENLTAELTLIPYVMDEIDAAVSGTIPAYEPSVRLDVTSGRTVPAPAIAAVQSDEAALFLASDGTLISRIVVSYSLAAGQPVETVNVQFRESGSLQWSSAPSVAPGSPAVVSDVRDGVAYDVRIRAVTQVGAASDWTVVSAHIVEGKTNPPPDVENVSWSVESGVLRLSWDAVDVLDLKEYLVKDASGTEVFRGFATSCTVPPQEAGTHTFTVWAVDTIEHPSDTGTVVSVTVTAPEQPSVDAAIEGPNILLSWNEPSAFFPLASGEVLYGADLEIATVIDAGLITTSRQVPGVAGDHRFWVRYTDSAGNVGSAGSVDITITAPGPVTVSPQVIDNNVLLSWSAPTSGTLPLDEYELRRGASWDEGTVIGSIKGLFSTFFESVSGTYTYWVAAIDVAGNQGTPGSASAVVDQPPDYVLYADLSSELDGTLTNVLAASDGGLLMPVNTTETWEGHFLGGITVSLEVSPGTYSFGGVSSNTAMGCFVTFPETWVDGVLFEFGGGGYGSWVGIRDGGTIFRLRSGSGSDLALAAYLDVPVSSLPQDGSVHFLAWDFKVSPGRVRFWVDGILIGTGDYDGVICPSGGNPGGYGQIGGSVTTGEPTDPWPGTLESNLYYAAVQLFASLPFGTLQNQIDAGYPYYLEPTPSSATYQETIDCGTILAGTKVIITPTSEIITGSVLLSCVLETSADGSTWTSLGSLWSAYATNFRYVRFTITATPDGGSNDLLRLVSVRVRLDTKLRNDAGMVTCSASDSGGTDVTFAVAFVDVQSITVTPAAGGDAKYALYDFTDVPNPTGFKALLYDANGNRVDGSASWAAKGV